MNSKDYKLVYYGNELLQKVADEIINIDSELAEFVKTMSRIMDRELGIGLAAPQIGVSKRIITVETDSYSGALINPVIKESSQKTAPYTEGCLSLPGISEEVIRPAEVFVSGFTPDGKEISIEAKGLLATVLQHEIDHLNGVVFIDRVEDYLRRELRPQIKRIKRLSREA